MKKMSEGDPAAPPPRPDFDNAKNVFVFDDDIVFTIRRRFLGSGDPVYNRLQVSITRAFSRQCSILLDDEIKLPE